MVEYCNKFIEMYRLYTTYTNNSCNLELVN